MNSSTLMHRGIVRSSSAAVLLCLTLLLSACGGGDDNRDEGNGGGGGNPPPMPQPGSVQFDPGAVSVDEQAGTVQLTITRTGGVAVHRHDWVNALYRVEVCNISGCSGSNALTAVDAMLQAIGYFKASNTQEGDQFGFSVALSADGSTLAVGAPFEGRNANGNSGKAVLDAGAVYVF